MASESNEDKVFVVMPDTFEDGIPVLSWVFSNFPQDRTKIIVTGVVTSHAEGNSLLNIMSTGLLRLLVDREKLDVTLNNYLSNCSLGEFRAEKLIHVANDIAQGIVEVIAKYGTKNLVMRSAANSDMTALTSETANKVMREANRHASYGLSLTKILYALGSPPLEPRLDNKILTRPPIREPNTDISILSELITGTGFITLTVREVNSDNLTPAPTSVERSLWNGRLNEASSSTSTSSNSVSGTNEGVHEDAFLIEMLNEASVEADNFEKKSEEIFEAHKKMARLVINLAKKLERKEQEIKEVRELLQREKQENNQLRQKIEESEQEDLRAEIEQIKTEKDLLRSQSDGYLNQIQLANDKTFALQTRISDMELEIEEYKIIAASVGSHIDSLHDEVSNLQQENSTLVGRVEELSSQRQNADSTSELNSEFSLQELQQATQNFSESLKIGQGGFGSVYKGSIRGTTVAIKLLHSESLQGVSQFQQEITILTKVRHPNLVTLMGACSEVSALVYEYLSNGSLEDRLACANNTRPLTWQARTRIIGEICLALIFLHSNKPQLVVHGDLKPENILLDTNLVSKLSDFGLSRILRQSDTNITAFCETSRIAGTFAYIDPEYVSTGILTAKSDTYSFGIIILRLLTGISPLNLKGKVQDAIRNGILLSMIDDTAGAWPFEQAQQLAMIALRCVELSRRQRPDLVDVLTVVEPLIKAAAAASVE